MGWIRNRGGMLFLSFAFLVGIGLMGYPAFSDWWNNFHQSRAVSSYLDSVAQLDTAEYEQIISDAEAYNQELSQRGFIWHMSAEDEARYNSLLSIDGSGIMGYINISKINVMLPIYHGTDDSVLQIAIGHLQGTSLPVGGLGSHCFISGHRGLPSAKLFTDLDKLVEGDTFQMTILDKTLTYQVDQIRTILPTDLSEMKMDPERDWCTLMTCTPYGINTHRLLIRGHRTKNPNGEAAVIADAVQIQPIYIAPFLAVPVLITMVIGVYISTGMNRRRRKWTEQMK